jgi:hypothetical protein
MYRGGDGNVGISSGLLICCWRGDGSFNWFVWLKFPAFMVAALRSPKARLFISPRLLLRYS